VDAVRLAVEEKRARFGTIDSWVIFNLTGEYVTDASNASRTYLCNLKGEWDEELISIAGITKEMLPKIVNSFEKCATIR
jgi:glycerol kinase